MGKIFFLTFIAGLGGLAGWAIAEPFAPLPQTVAWSRWEVLFALSVGGLIGVAVGAASGYLQGSRVHFLRGALGGLLLGAVGGCLGLAIGGNLAHGLFGPGVFAENVALGTRSVARTLVFVPFGGLVGLIYGLGSRSVTRAIQGLIGGVIGGALGGACFDSIGEAVGRAILALRGQVSGEVGVISRAVASAAVGAGIGLFVGIVEAISKRAWLRLELGRNEGKEWIVDAPQTFIGRSETAHVPLFGDANVMPLHACIVRERGSYRLLDGGSPMGIGVNGIRVPEATLNHGDVLNLGSFSLRFLLRNPGAAVPARAEATPAQPLAVGLPPIAAAPKPYALVALDGPMAGRRFAMDAAELVAGRESPQLGLGFDGSVSRRHASFTPGPSGVIVRDLGSTNGTLVNGVRVQEMALRPGDTVKIGTTTFRLE